MSGNYEHGSHTVCHWLRRVVEGKVGLPSFQRGYVWDEEKVADLIHALWMGQPVGSLLVIDYKDADGKASFSPEKIQGQKCNLDDCEEIILDGQQRLTALFHAFGNDFDESDLHQVEHRFYLKVADAQNGNLFVNEVKSFKKKSAPTDVKTMFEDNLIPVHILGIDGVTQEKKALSEWCRTACDNISNKKDDLEEGIKDTIQNVMLGQRIWHNKLPQGTSRRDAVKIFIRTNKSSEIVKPLDIAVALIEENDENGFRNKVIGWIKSEEKIGRYFLKKGEKKIREIQEALIKVACLREGLDPKESEFGNKKVIEQIRDEGTLKQIQKGFLWAFDFLEEECVYNGKYLPSIVPLRVLPSLHDEFSKLDSDQEGKARRLLRSYLWRSFLTARYVRTVSTMLREDRNQLNADLQRLSSSSGGDPKYSAPIFGYDLPKEESLCSLEEPLRPPGTSKAKLSNALICISLYKKALDFASGAPISKMDPHKIQAHHLFPKGFLKTIDVEDKDEQNHALNYALIDGITNARLKDKPPSEYLNDRLKKDRKLTKEALKNIIESHLIPFEKLNVDRSASRSSYEKFLRARAKLLMKAIKRLAEGEPHF